MSDAVEEAERKKSKDIRQVGLSVYIRKKVKQETADGNSKTKTFWILEGKAFDEQEYVWEERRARDGHVQYRNALTREPVLALPDKGPTQSTLVGVNEPALSPQRVKAEPRPGWTSDKKTVVQSFVKKRLQQPTKERVITAEALKTLVKNVADQFTAETNPFDGDVPPEAAEEELAEMTNRALEAWVQERSEAVERLLSAADYRDLDFIDPPPLDEEAALPERPAKEPPAPVSPLLPRAGYLRDPYYYLRLDYPNPRRGRLEEELESKLFFNQSLGELKVLGAVEGWICHPSDPLQNQPTIVAAVRDWAGAACLTYIQPPSAGVSDHYVVTSIHPLSEHLEMGKLLGKQAGSEILRGIVLVDDQRHVLGFRNAEDHGYLDLVLKLAMCSMYGQGSESERIVDMRAHSVELAWNHTPPVPEEAAMADFEYLMAGPVDEVDTAPSGDRTTDTLVNDIRLFMLGTENRDTVLRRWVSIVKRGVPANNDRELRERVVRQLRIIEEAIRYPSPSNDPFIHDAVLEQLGTVQLELSRLAADDAEAVPWGLQPSRLIALWKLTTQSLQAFRSRESLPDVPFERFCEPAPSSEAAAIQLEALQERRRFYEPDQLLSGVYLSALVYCKDGGGGCDILTNAHDNLPCEVVQDLLSDAKVESLHRDSDDFKWVLENGVDPDWAYNLQVYSQVYDNVGTARFRAYFIDAAKRLQNQLGRSDLGVVFDDVVVQKEVGCLHIITVLRVQTRDDIPVDSAFHAGWAWRPKAEVEQRTYLKSFDVNASARVAFMSATYQNCRRWVHAAVQYKESLDYRLEAHPGVYLAYFGAAPDSTGFRVMVSESHRFIVPLARIQEGFPTIEEWRWVQCLNEKRRRLGSFEWDTVSASVTAASLPAETPTFRHRFLRAVLEMEQTVGREVTHIYDVEVFSFDELGKIKIIAVGERFKEEPAPHAPPPNTSAVTFKNHEMVQALYFRHFWPGVSRLFTEAKAAADAAQIRVCTPFAVDEALRLDHEGALAHLTEVEAMMLPLRWLWTLWRWSCRGYPTVVSEYEGVADRALVRSVESSVENAVANHATQQDLNYMTARSIAADGRHASEWEALYPKLREVHRTMKAGYAQRVQQVPPESEHVGRERTWDELYSDEESEDDDVERPPTIYHMDCTIEELVEKDGADNTSGAGPNLYFTMQQIVWDVVELSLIESVDASIIKVCGQVINDLVSVIEWTDGLTSDAVVASLTDQAVEATVHENNLFKQTWCEAFLDAETDAGGGGGAAGGNGVDGVFEYNTDEEDEGYVLGAASPSGIPFDAPVPMFQQGSDKTVVSPEHGVRVCLAKAMNAVGQCERVLSIIASAQEVAELTDCISDYDDAVSKQVGIIKASVGAGTGGGTKGYLGGGGGAASPSATVVTINTQAAEAAAATPAAEHFASDAGANDANDAPLVMISSDFEEFPLARIDVERAASLAHAAGKIRFPDVAGPLLSVVASFLNVAEGGLEGWLRGLGAHCAEAGVGAEELVSLAVQMRAPLLLAAAAGLVYGTPLTTGATAVHHTFAGDAAQRFWTAASPVYMAFSVPQWLAWAEQGGVAVAPALDVCWWGRAGVEAPAGEPEPTDYSAHEGTWRQMYAETRLAAFLKRGLGSLPQEELLLWRGGLGTLVEYVSFKQCAAVGDQEVDVLTQCCPELRSIDLSLTQVTDTAAGYLLQRSSRLTDVNVDGSAVCKKKKKKKKRKRKGGKGHG